MPDLPDDIDEDNDDAILQFYSQHTQALTSVQRATIFKNNFVDCIRRLCRIWREYKNRDMNIINEFNKMAAAFNEITIPGMLVRFPDFFYSMYKHNNLEQTIINCIYLDFIYTASVMKSALIAGSASKRETRLKQYRFGYNSVIVGNHIYRKLMVIPTMCKFVLFGPFYLKIGLD